MVDENKIAFLVSNVNNSSLKRLKNFLSGCALPENFSLELNVVSTAGNKAEAYNKAMLKSTAKYKFYLDEYTVPLERDFIKRIISLFAGNPQIGLVGCLGITELPLNGILYEASREDVFGKCFVDNPKMLAQYAEFDGLYKEVQCVFGGLIATQYDVQWREDLFTDNANYFYVASQCIEFARNNYTVAVISQDEPLIWDRKADYSINDSDRQSFLKEYSADVFPLVSVIIPTFERPKFFKIALDSVLNQTYLNLDIMISDNSNDNRTEDLMQPYLARDKRIKYYHHRDFDRGGNWSFCRSYDNPKAEYVNWLMDDDLFAPRKIELMVDCYRKNPDVSLVFSNRLFIDAEGKIIKQHTVSENNFKMSGEEAGRQLFFRDNFIGEPTTVLIKKKYLRNNDLGRTKVESNFERIDFSTWLYILEQGNLFCFAEPLSSVRIHENQASKSLETQMKFVIEYIYEIIYDWENKFFLKTASDLRRSAMFVVLLGLEKLRWAYEANYSGEYLPLLEKSVRDIMDRLMIASLNEK